MFRRKDENDMPATSSTTAQNTQSAPANANEGMMSGVPGYAAANAAVTQQRPAMAETKASAMPSVPSAPTAPSAPSSGYRPAAPSAARASAANAAAQTSNAMSEKANSKGTKRVLTVGNDILLKGEIATCDRLVIEGKVDATLKDVHTVELAQTGSFKGTAEVEDAEISGLFEGDLIVRNRLVIYSTGKVRGKITYGEIEIERGGELTGEINASASASMGNTARKAA